MKRKRRCDSEKQTYWEAVVRRWERGGQTVREFCRAENLRESAFYFWRRELARRNQSSRPVSQPDFKVPAVAPAPATSKRSPSPQRGRVSFLPVRVVEDAAVAAARGVEIVLAHGRTVRVAAGFDRQTLAEVLAVLEGRPC